MVAAIRVALEVADNGLQDFVIRTFGTLEYNDFLLESLEKTLEIAVIPAQGVNDRRYRPAFVPPAGFRRDGPTRPLRLHR